MFDKIPCIQGTPQRRGKWFIGRLYNHHSRNPDLPCQNLFPHCPICHGGRAKIYNPSTWHPVRQIHWNSTNPLNLGMCIKHALLYSRFIIFFIHLLSPAGLSSNCFTNTDCLLPWWSCSNHASWWSCSNHSRKNALKRVNFWAVLLQTQKQRENHEKQQTYKSFQDISRFGSI